MLEFGNFRDGGTKNSIDNFVLEKAIPEFGNFRLGDEQNCLTNVASVKFGQEFCQECSDLYLLVY